MPKENEISLTRIFDAQTKSIWSAWTDPKKLVQWLPPTGLTMECSRADVKIGGAVVFKMTDGKSINIFGRFQYRDLVIDKRIMYVQEFLDNKGNLSRHPMLQVFPSRLLVIIELSEEGHSQTKVILRVEPNGAYNKEEAEAFNGHIGDMTMGWTGSFDKLDDLL